MVTLHARMDARPRRGRSPTAGGAGGLFLAAVLAALPAGPARAQDTPREVRAAANAKLARGEFMDAIPDLQQLIAWFGESTETSTVAGMEMIYYNLAICHFFIGQFGEAQTAFETYLKKYPHGSKRAYAALYIADSMRFGNKMDDALKQYEQILRKYDYGPDLLADIYSAIARCHLAGDDWKSAIEPLREVYRWAPDFLRRNWAATLLTTAFFKQLDLDSVYEIVPYLLRPNSFASRSIAFNLAALEAGDELFAVERYRDALWVFRMVYPHDVVMVRAQEYLEQLQTRADRLRESLGGDPRELMRLQESMGELEEEIKAMQEIANYDVELQFRIARGYMEMLRFWEGRELFLYLHRVCEKAQAEEALFLAFQCSVQLLPWDRAFEIGNQYIEKYPGGEYFDYLTLVMGQMYARQQDWPKVIELLTKALEISPKHQSAAECMFLIGYASFMEEKFEDAVRWLGRMVAEFPASELVGDATYWTGMACMFDRKYAEAATAFDRLLQEFPDCIYIEDASFRRAVCDYGLSRYADSDAKLAAFISRYPRGKLLSEAQMMRGDIAGANGEIEPAVQFYQSAMTDTNINIEFYNHCAFQAGQILADDERYDELIGHFKRYIADAREGSNLPQAIYWVGVALWNKNEREGALRYYRQAVERYGKDPGAVGIDMILDEWIGRIRRSEAAEAEQAWAEFKVSLDNAARDGNTTMALRLKRVALFDPHTSSTDRQRIVNEFLSEENIAAASPSVLQTMLDTAKEKGRRDFAIKAAEHIIATFTETDYALDARMVLADWAIESARKATNPAGAKQFYDEAVKHLDVVREVFASSAEAGEALLLLGKLYREQGKYEQAEECYKQILGVKTWRSAWPEALYWRGECAFESRQYDVAASYYERIYLMYSHYRQWTAMAYLRRAEALRKMFQDGKAREVLEDMLKNTELSDLPEYEKAKALLVRLGGTT